MARLARKAACASAFFFFLSAASDMDIRVLEGMLSSDPFEVVDVGLWLWGM